MKKSRVQGSCTAAIACLLHRLCTNQHGIANMRYGQSVHRSQCMTGIWFFVVVVGQTTTRQASNLLFSNGRTVQMGTHANKTIHT